MQKVGYWYIWAGLLWLVASMAFGTWLGAAGKFGYAESHAHMGLVGFAISVIFGLLHGQFPGLAQSRLALWQFLVYELGAIVLIAGKITVDGGGSETLVKIGSIIVIIGTLMMLWLFAARAKA
jgi:hypothetical protein